MVILVHTALGKDLGGRSVDAVVKGYASPYSTGGGGVVFELAYGGMLLARLLEQGPVSGLGEDVTPIQVRFQQHASYPVDDMLVIGQCPTGERRMFVGVRRNPTFGASSPAFVALLADYLHMIVEYPSEFDSGRWRLGLVVADPHTPATQVRTLARLARGHADSAQFRAAVSAPLATRATIRKRLEVFDAAVSAARPAADDGDLSWQLLRALHIIHVAIEGDDAADRSRVIAGLSKLADGVANAVDLWRHLVELSAGYAQTAATVDRAVLQRDLGTRIELAPPAAAVVAEHGHRLPAAIRVSRADPRRLGVHAAIQLEGVGDGVPSYVERDVDGGERGIRALLSKAADRGGFVLLVGGSSVGKTRCAYEAVRAVLPDWSLIQPQEPEDVVALSVQPARRVVLWLDEIQRYLGGERGITAGVVRALLSAAWQVVIVGTIWPDRFLSFTEPPAYWASDLHSEEREVLKLAEVVLVAPKFSAAEQRRAEVAATTDRLLARALGTAGYGLTQTLAAVPQLISHWDIARTVHPYAWAVLSAALDISMLGAEHPLPEALLREAAPAYCTDQQRAEAPADWFEQGLGYATRKLHGAVSALTAIGGTEMGKTVGYVVADYLRQRMGLTRAEPVPARVWDAIVAHLTDIDDVVAVAESAGARMLYRYAVPLLRRAADAGSRTAAEQWAVHVSDLEGLVELMVQAEFEGEDSWPPIDTKAAQGLTDALVHLGNLEALLAGLRPDHFVDGRFLNRRLARILADHGAIERLEALADRGDPYAAGLLTDILAWHGDAGQTSGQARTASTVRPSYVDEKPDTVPAGTGWAAALVWPAEEPELAQDPLDQPWTDAARTASAGGAPNLSIQQQFALLRNAGDVAGLLRLAEQRPGTVDAELVEVLARRGDLNELMSIAARADEMLRDRIAYVFVHRGAFDLLESLIEYGWTAAERLAAALADRGDIAALTEFAKRDGWGVDVLCGLLTARGDVAALRALASQDVHDDEEATQVLNDVLADRGEFGELADRARDGDSNAARKLAFVLADRGDLDAAWRVLREAGLDRYWRVASIHDELAVDLDDLRRRAAEGDEAVAYRLADALVRRGDFDQLRERAREGDSPAASRLAEAYVRRGEADRLRALANDGHRSAAQQLMDVLAYRGQVDELTARADSGDRTAADRLRELLVRRGDVQALRRRADAGDLQADRCWREVTSDRGDVDSLRDLARRDFMAAHDLTEINTDRGDLDELRTRADNHELNARERLAELLADRKELDELRARADHGDWSAQTALAHALAGRSDVNELRARVTRQPYDFPATRVLIELLIGQGDLAEAKRLLLTSVQLGDPWAAKRLPALLARLGQSRQAQRLARYGLNPDGSPVSPTDVQW